MKTRLDQQVAWAACYYLRARKWVWGWGLIVLKGDEDKWEVDGVLMVFLWSFWEKMEVDSGGRGYDWRVVLGVEGECF